MPNICFKICNGLLQNGIIQLNIIPAQGLYAYSRVGTTLPENIHSGFYNLSAYLQAAAMQAEQLCREAEAYCLPKPLKSKGKEKVPVVSDDEKKKPPHCFFDQISIPPALQSVLELTFGFQPTARTLTYILKRFNKLGYSQRSKSFFKKILKRSRLNDFRSIYQEIINRDPFKDINNRNIDIINAVNFALFDEIEGTKVAKEGLRSTLKWRKDRLSL